MMYNILGTIFSTLNDLTIGNFHLSYAIGFFVAVPILAYLLKKSK